MEWYTYHLKKDSFRKPSMLWLTHPGLIWTSPELSDNSVSGNSQSQWSVGACWFGGRARGKHTGTRCDRNTCSNRDKPKSISSQVQVVAGEITVVYSWCHVCSLAQYSFNSRRTGNTSLRLVDMCVNSYVLNSVQQQGIRVAVLCFHRDVRLVCALSHAPDVFGTCNLIRNVLSLGKRKNAHVKTKFLVSRQQKPKEKCTLHVGEVRDTCTHKHAAAVTIFVSFWCRIAFGKYLSPQSGARTKRSRGMHLITLWTLSTICSTVSTLLLAMVTTPKISVLFLNLRNKDSSLCRWQSSMETEKENVKFTIVKIQKQVGLPCSQGPKRLWLSTLVCAIYFCQILIHPAFQPSYGTPLDQPSNNRFGPGTRGSHSTGEWLSSHAHQPPGNNFTMRLCVKEAVCIVEVSRGF